jgi:5-methylcytosine-specific restriction enzyme A
MGLVGDQDINRAQNRTLAESRTSGVDVHLFEVHKEKEYTYVGRVTLDGDPFQDQQLDVNDQLRQVWVFPLRIANPIPPLTSETFQKEEEHRISRARKLADDLLALRAAAAPRVPGERIVASRRYERNPYVSDFAKRRANGHCDLCGSPAPFADSSGEPFLETHHVVWLGSGGVDAIENTVALCPNCHRKMHILDLDVDREHLLARAMRPV